MSSEQTQQADDPSGEGWRDVGDKEPLQSGDMYLADNYWRETNNVGGLVYGHGIRYRRRIEPQQPSDSGPETMDDLRKRLAECEVLLAEADRGGQQVNAELQQLREQLQTLTRERDRYRNQLAGAIEHSKAPEAQELPTKTQELETKTQELPEYTPPEGWRLVRFGELLLPGDEIVQIDDGRRYPTHRIGDAVGPNQQYIRRIKPQPQPEPQLTPDDPSGDGWRWVEVGEVLRHTDMFRLSYGAWVFTQKKGLSVREGWEHTYRRRIEQQPEAQPQTQQADDPSGPGWRDVEPDELLQDGDMLKNNTGLWLRTMAPGRVAREGGGGTYRRRIEPQQPSDSEQRSESTLWGKLHAAMKQDPEFAWTVHCNYAMQIMDEDVAHGTANRAAARIMLYFHHIDITQNHHWATMFEGATPPQPSDSQPQPNADDPSGPGWRDVEPDELLQDGDMLKNNTGLWLRTGVPGRLAREGYGGTYRRRIEPQPQPQPEPQPESEPDAATIEELRSEVAYVQRLLGTERQRVTQLDELVGSLRTINEAQEKAFEAAGKENTALRNQLAAVKAELASVAADRQRLRVELDAAQQVPADSPELRQLRLRLADMTLDRDQYKDAWNQIFTDQTTIRETTAAETVEAIIEWLQHFRGCNSPALALLLLEALPHIMRSLTGLANAFE